MRANTIGRDSVAPSTKKKASALDPQLADKLLELLGTDDVFRQLFKNNPQQALEKIGFFGIAHGGITRWLLLGIKKLASKAAILESRTELKAMLTVALGMTPVHSNIASKAGPLKRSI